MIYRTLLILLPCLFLYSTLSAQLFSGVHALNLLSKGTQHETHFSSPQVISEFNMPRGQLRLMFKTQTMTKGADDRTQRMLREVLLIDSNPLFQVVADMSSLELSAGQNYEQTNLDVPVVVFYHQQALNAFAKIKHIRYVNNQLEISISLPLHLDDLNLSVAAENLPFMSDQLTLQLDKAILTPR